MPEHLAFTYEEFSIEVAELDSFFALLWFQENKFMDSTETAMKCQQYTTQQSFLRFPEMCCRIDITRDFKHPQLKCENMSYDWHSEVVYKMQIWKCEYRSNYRQKSAESISTLNIKWNSLSSYNAHSKDANLEVRIHI